MRAPPVEPLVELYCGLCALVSTTVGYTSIPIHAHSAHPTFPTPTFQPYLGANGVLPPVHVAVCGARAGSTLERLYAIGCFGWDS